MIPPTPTPFPIVPNDMPVLEFPSVWQLAPDAIQTWNSFGEAVHVLQAILLAMVIGLGIYMLYRFLRRLTEGSGS